MTGDRRSPARESRRDDWCLLHRHFVLIASSGLPAATGEKTTWGSDPENVRGSSCPQVITTSKYPRPPARPGPSSTARVGWLHRPRGDSRGRKRFKGEEYPSFQFRWCRTVRSRLSIIWTVGRERCGKGYLAGIARRGGRCGGGALVRERDESRACCVHSCCWCALRFRSLLYWISSDRSEALESACCSFFPSLA
jgi:hypothetical protein